MNTALIHQPIARTPDVSWQGTANIAAFFSVHLVCLAAFWTGVSRLAMGLMVGSFLIRMFGITAGYHRYFSHRTYKVNRVVQFAMAWIGCSSAQKGPLWWAAHHRAHHQNSDTRSDIHSPIREGFWWSHVGWILSSQYDDTNYKIIPDLARYPELMWMNKHFLVPPVVWGALCLLIGGAQGLVWGFFISTTLLWHATFLINSAAHLMGRRRFDTTDSSRNSVILALLTLGEGWHNNHHYFPSSTNQGFYWWEIDITYYALKLMQKIGLTKELRNPPQRVLELGRKIMTQRRSKSSDGKTPVSA